ncbi:MAG: ribosomal RNA small subunit methyltransferase A [Deltaproteobacteria bacterium]|nr:ribosomal RNA small subunit methyltransferase A [Deltaproteobacteria bacterium]
MAAPKRSLGQVFLASEAVAARIVAAIGAGPGDRVVEIGPGRGAITRLIADTGAAVVAIEKDTDLAADLAERYAGRSDVRVVNGDATDPEVVGSALPREGRAAVAGNLPYNAGGPILGALLRHRSRISRMVLMFQREVAHRLAAAPGDREYGALSLAVRCRASVELLFDVAPDRFRPVPKVWSSVVRVTPADLPHPAAREADDPAVEALAHALHAQPRKTVANSLANGLGVPRAEAESLLARAGIDPALRPAHVTPMQLMDLWALLHGGPRPAPAVRT